MSRAIIRVGSVWQLHGQRWTVLRRDRPRHGESGGLYVMRREDGHTEARSRDYVLSGAEVRP